MVTVAVRRSCTSSPLDSGNYRGKLFHPVKVRTCTFAFKSARARVKNVKYPSSRHVRLCSVTDDHCRLYYSGAHDPRPLPPSRRRACVRSLTDVTCRPNPCRGITGDGSNESVRTKTCGDCIGKKKKLKTTVVRTRAVW